MYSRFERLVDPTADPPPGAPPAGLAAFFWHFARQTKGLYAALFVTGALMALVDTLIPLFMGRVVSIATAPSAELAFGDGLPGLVLLGLGIVVGAPVVNLADSLVRHVGLGSNATVLARWQSHWHVVRQSWPFFQNDFAGRIGNRVMSVGNAVKETLMAAIRALWYILVYGATAITLIARLDWTLAVPVALWFALYGLFLFKTVPRMRDRAKDTSLARSLVSGRVVDSYTNILTVKLFARQSDEDAHVRGAMDESLFRMRAQMRLTSLFMVLLGLMNVALLASTAMLALPLWREGHIGAAAIAVALPLVWRVTNMAGWVAFEITGIFENIGTVQESMMTIAVPHGLLDAPDAVELEPGPGAVVFERVRFGYGTGRPVLDDLSLAIAPGERIGIVGRSGAGKSTLVNLLLRFYDVEGGRILVDGQDISRVSQESLRAAVGMVTQDTSLLHRSIADNIRYGRREASDAQVEAAARRAEADGFIQTLTDWGGRTGYAAHVGERGVKLSGGQRQRIAIARVVLKDAPILILDEATSALDSEVEAAIQGQLDALMGGKTVLAIAHRLSTIARMDRLVVLDGGRVVETGTHRDLVSRGGIYADLWARQSGGFLGAEERLAAE